MPAGGTISLSIGAVADITRTTPVIECQGEGELLVDQGRYGQAQVTSGVATSKIRSSSIQLLSGQKRLAIRESFLATPSFFVLSRFGRPPFVADAK